MWKNKKKKNPDVCFCNTTIMKGDNHIRIVFRIVADIRNFDIIVLEWSGNCGEIMQNITLCADSYHGEKMLQKCTNASINIMSLFN